MGGATGVHAAWLAADGYRVHLVGLAPRHVAEANAELGRLGVTAERGDARQLPVPDSAYDAVLLFGPLYHLTERRDRLRALREAARVARPGAIVAVAAVSRFASLFDGLSRQFLFGPGFRAIAAQDLQDGQHRNPDQRSGWWTTAYFHHPDELRHEVSEAGLAVRELVGLAGLAFWLPQLADRWDDQDDREAILWSAHAIESEPSLAFLSAHLLLVAEQASSRGPSVARCDEAGGTLGRRSASPPTPSDPVVDAPHNGSRCCDCDSRALSGQAALREPTCLRT